MRVVLGWSLAWSLPIVVRSTDKEVQNIWRSSNVVALELCVGKQLMPDSSWDCEA